MPRVPIHDALCFGHQLSITADDVMEKDMVNAIHATKKLWGNSLPRESFLTAVDKAIDQAAVLRGVAPDPAWAAHADLVLEHTLLGLDGVSLADYRNGDEGRCLDLAAVREFHSLFNGDWTCPTIRHYCSKRLSPGLNVPCCVSEKESRTKMKQATRKLLVPLFASAAAGDTKKWCEGTRAASITGHFLMCHGLVKKATAPWRRRRKVTGEFEELSEIHDTDDFARKRRKREAKAGLFWARPETPERVLAAAAITQPVRELLSRMFAAERNARLFAGGPEAREQLKAAGFAPAEGHTYIGDFIKPGGYICGTDDRIAALLEDGVLSDTRLFAFQEGTDKAHVVLTRNRGMLLRLYSGFSDRIRDPLLKDESFYGMLQMHETDDQEDALEKARRFMSCSPCCAEPIFVLPM